MYCNKKLEMTWWYLETDRVDDECLKTAVQARYSWRATRVSHRSQLPTGNRLMDSVLAFWSYTETGVIYCFERSGRCLPLLFNPIQHAPGFVEVWMSSSSRGLQKQQTLQSELRTGESRVLLPVFGWRAARISSSWQLLDQVLFLHTCDMSTVNST